MNIVAKGESFAMETTLSGLGYARSIPACERSWVSNKINLFGVAQMRQTAIDRVAARVSHRQEIMIPGRCYSQNDLKLSIRKLPVTVYKPLD